MRPLHRPMFRYGGPIKEGVMSGIREPKKGGGAMGNQALLVGNPAFPMQGGRRMHAEQLSLFDVLKKSAGQTLTGMKKEPIKTVLPGKKLKASAGIISNLTKRIPKWWARHKPTAKFRHPSVTQHPGSSFQYVPRPYSKWEIAKNPKLWWRAARENPKTAVGLGYGAVTDPGQAVIGGIPGAAKWAAEVVTPGDWEKYLPWNRKEDLPPPPEGDGTSIFETEKIVTEPKKSAEEIRNERIQKYRDIMDIKGMNKRAAYDSLIDASKLITESGDFKGDIKSGNLINQIIQATSKQFDKPSKTKDAIDTLILKGEIEADIAAGKPSTYLKTAQDMVATGAAKNITEAMKTLTKSGNSMSTTLGAIVSKGGRLDEENVGIAYRDETGNIPKGMIKESEVNEWIEDNPGKNELDYTKELITNTELAPGDYVIGTRVVTVDKDNKVSFFY